MDRAAQNLYGFIWDEYCSWYVRAFQNRPYWMLTQVPRNAGGYTSHLGASSGGDTLRLLHPLMPFITEQIWQQIAPLADKQGTTIMIQPYPQAEVTDKIDNDALAEVSSGYRRWSLLIRNVRGERNIEPGKELSIIVTSSVPNKTCSDWKAIASYLTALARLSSIEVLETDANRCRKVHQCRWLDG